MGSEAARTPAEAARAWKTSLPREFRHKTNWQGCLVFALSASLYVLSLFGMFLLGTWWLQLASAVACPILIGALFVIGHDAAHGVLVRSAWLNRLLGRLAMLPAYHPFAAWAYTHNTLHHGWTNLKGRHPDFAPYSKAEYDALPAWRRWLERVYRTPWGIGLCYAFDFYLFRLLFPRPAHRSPYRTAFQLDRLLVASFFVGQCLLAAWLVQHVPDRQLPVALHYAVAVTAPWGFWIWFMGFVSFLQHTHPTMAWYDNEKEWSFYHVQLRSTAHVVFPWPIERVLHNIMDHPAHHIDPTIPLYRLPKAQKALEESAPEYTNVIYWTPWDYLRTCGQCKLYDFERHCWTDFAGRPTTPCLLPDLPRCRPTDTNPPLRELHHDPR